MGDEAAQRRAERHRNAEYHAATAKERRAVESAKASEMVRAFAREAAARGLATTELQAKAYSGSGRYRTGLHGWYLRSDRTIGVDRAGGYYVLVVAPSLKARITGVEVEPTDPPLQVGAGARDGDSVALDVLLATRLAAGDTFGR